MATLVLTVAGGAIGGPIGAAIGGLIGNAVDREIFRPAGREGPRLSELRLQTSSYGTPIPKVFGAMRMAGSVIWATDLIEHRSTGRSGKGQPSVTSYSYTASFAVALSGRRIGGVGRIWADGKLLRGTEGDWKSATGFRLHLGGEDQVPDPLIASLEGATVSPAHRGTAYAVFEDMQLADYGNRIPSLTFEVIADGGGAAIAAIVSEIGEGAAIGAGTATVEGFAAYGNDARTVIELLGAAAGAWFAPEGDGLRMRVDTGGAQAIADGGFGRQGHRRARTIRAIETVPKVLSIAHYEPLRDYQAGVQSARRPGAGTRAERVDLPVAMDAGAAAAMAQAMLARAEAARVRRTVTLDATALTITPGAIVTIAGESDRWRVASAALEAMAVELELVPLARGAPVPVANGGRVLGAPDLAAGTTILAAFETPALDDALATQPRLTIVAGGSASGWRRAALLYSLDDGASWLPGGSTAAPGVLGTVLVPPGAGPATLIDRVNTIEVELANDAMTLESADAGAIDRGANLALAGGELLQFAEAEQIAPRRWRLRALMRGRRAMAGACATGDRFVLIERETCVTIALPLAMAGRAVRVLATGIGDTGGPIEVPADVSGLSIAPPAPVALRAEPLPDGMLVRWTRRSRLGWTWVDAVDAPLGEESEAYRVVVAPSAGAARTAVVTTPEIALTAEEAAGATVSVRQLGTLAESRAATIEL